MDCFVCVFCMLFVLCWCVWVLFYFGMRCDLNSFCFDVLLDVCVVELCVVF